MGNFNRNNERQGGGFHRGFGGGKTFGGGNRFGGRDGQVSSDRPMHRAVCDTCGADFELPFRPKGDRPVFCKDCFGKKGESGRPHTFSDERNERRERPGGTVFFGKDGSQDKCSKEVVEQLKLLNTKIDALVKVLTLSAVGEKIKKPEQKEEAIMDESIKEKKEKIKKKTVSKKA